MVLEPVEKLFSSFTLHVSFDGGTPPQAASGDDLHPVPHLLHVVALQLLLQLSPVLLLRLPELDPEFPLHMLKLLRITVFKGHLLLVQKALMSLVIQGLLLA